MVMKDFPNKCLGCKKEDVPLNKFEHVIRTKKRNPFTNVKITREKKIEFPACDICEMKFEKAMKANNLARRFKSILIYIIIGLIIFLVVDYFTMFHTTLHFLPLDFNLLILIIIGIVAFLSIAFLVQIIMAGKNPYKISNFLTLHKNNTYSIKDPDYAQETSQIIQERIEEEVKEELFGIDEDKAIYCPKCGAQSKKGTDFCKKCGKDLRLVQ